MAKSTNAPVPRLPARFAVPPPVRPPVTGVPAPPGFPDATKGNAFGPRPTGKEQKR